MLIITLLAKLFKNVDQGKGFQYLGLNKASPNERAGQKRMGTIVNF